MAEYKGPQWKNAPDTSTPLAADPLNALTRAVEDHGERLAEVEGAEAPAAPTADTLTGATATGKSVMKAASQEAARTAIGAGTSNLAIGATGTTAAAGDHSHSYDSLTGKPTIPTLPAQGTPAQLTAGTDGATRLWTAREIATFVRAEVDAAKAELRAEFEAVDGGAK